MTGKGAGLWWAKLSRGTSKVFKSKVMTALLITAALALGICRQFDAAPPAPAPLGADINQNLVSKAESNVDLLSSEIQSMVPGKEATSATESPISLSANTAESVVAQPGPVTAQKRDEPLSMESVPVTPDSTTGTYHRTRSPDWARRRQESVVGLGQ